MRARKTTLTAEELLRMSGGDMRYELVKGELYEMPPAGASHGSVAMQIGALLSVHVNAHRLGWTFAAETGFVLGATPTRCAPPTRPSWAGTGFQRVS